jgi:dTDP-4-dehydrorhamnose reductase
MRIAILGASGQIGMVIYDHLKMSYEVVGTSRNAGDRFQQFDPFEDDWSVLGKPDVLINCVGQIEATAKSSFYHIHVDLTKQILSHRAQLGNPRIIQISALGASPGHKVEFLRTKGIADELLLQHPDTAVIRPSIVCTHRTMIVKKMIMLSNLAAFLFGFLPVPKGFLQTRIQPIMPEDLAEVVQEVCSRRDIKLVEAVGPERLSFYEIIQILIRNRNRKFKVIEVSKRATDLLVQTFLSRLLPNVINAQQYQLLFEDNVGPVEPCKELLGRMPLSTRDFFEDQFSL